MSLDFYRAKSRNNIDFNNEFVGLDDELQEYLHKNRGSIKYDVKCIYEIDAYSDTELDSSTIKLIMDVCSKIKTDDFLANYEDAEEAEEVFAGLEKLCKNALENGQKIFAIGD